MDKQTQKVVKKSIIKYKWQKWLYNRPWQLDEDRGQKADRISALRNGIFFLMQDTVKSHIQKILKRWGKWEVETEILALTWDAFYFCLERYRNFDLPIPYHFYLYTRYYLLDHYGRKDRVLLPLDELREILSIEPTPDNALFCKLLTICDYRSQFPEKFHVIFDDAFQSLHPAPRYQQRTPDMGGHPKAVYEAVKKVFIVTLNYLTK